MNATGRTGFDLRQGAIILAERRAEKERAERIAELARLALEILDGRRAA
jgi:hypothetical protein